MARISKKVREEAILVAAVRASDRPDDPRATHGTRCDDLDVARTGPAGMLAWRAFSAADDAIGNGEQDAWLEAAALLRGDDEHEPWSPGDPVTLKVTPVTLPPAITAALIAYRRAVKDTEGCPSVDAIEAENAALAALVDAITAALPSGEAVAWGDEECDGGLRQFIIDRGPVRAIVRYGFDDGMALALLLYSPHGVTVELRRSWWGRAGQPAEETIAEAKDAVLGWAREIGAIATAPTATAPVLTVGTALSRPEVQRGEGDDDLAFEKLLDAITLLTDLLEAVAGPEK